MSKKGMGKFLVGAGIGAAITALFTTEKGKEYQAKISTMCEEFIKKVREMDSDEVKTNIDGIVGKEGKVTIDILPHEVGEVKVEGKLWTAVADCEIKKDAYIEVLAVDGVKLVVKELDN